MCQPSDLEERFGVVVAGVAGQPGVTPPDSIPSAEKFGSAQELRVDGQIFAMLSRGRFVLKLPAPRVRALTAAGQGQPFATGHGRPMREWLVVDPDAAIDWLNLAGEALVFVRGNGPRRPKAQAGPPP